MRGLSLIFVASVASWCVCLFLNNNYKDGNEWWLILF